MNMLAMVKKGYASDPPSLSMYIPKNNHNGAPMVDKDGLVLYRSIRGTSNLESLHQYLTTSFGHTMAGPWYSDVLLAVVRHFYNWRMSIKNRPNFPGVTHYDGLLVDRINSLYEVIFGYPKHREWSSFNENLPTEYAYGIVPVNNAHTLNIKQISDADKRCFSEKSTLFYLANRQKSIVPFLPIRGYREKKLIHRKLNHAIARDESLQNQTIFEKLSIDWNKTAVSISSKIYPKLPCHFARYVKGWRKNQDRRDAEIASGANRLSSALEHIPADYLSRPIFETCPLDEPLLEPADDNGNDNDADWTPDQNEESDEDEATGFEIVPYTGTQNQTQSQSLTQTETQNLTQMSMELVCQVCRTEPVFQPTGPKRKKPRTCKVTIDGRKCPIPNTCVGRFNRVNCILITKGDETKKVRRKITVRTLKRCQLCGRQEPDCPGIRNRKQCTGQRERLV